MRGVEVMRMKGIRRIPIVVGGHAGGPARRRRPQARAAVRALGVGGGVQPRDGGDAGLADHDQGPRHGGPRTRCSPTRRRRSTARSSGRCRWCATGAWWAYSPTPTSCAAWTTSSPTGVDGARGRGRRHLLRRLRAAVRRPGGGVVPRGAGAHHAGPPPRLAAGQRPRRGRRPRPAHGPLLEAGHDVTVYGSPRCAATAPRPAGRRPRPVRRQATSARPWPERAFDVVVSFRLLPHVAAWRELVGRAVPAGPARGARGLPHRAQRERGGGAALRARRRRVEGDTRPFTVFRDADVAAAFAAHGFRATARRPEFFLPMALHRAVGAAPLRAGLEAAARGLGLVRVLGSPVILRAEPRG